MHSNQYTLIYAAVISIVTAVVLAVTAEGLRPAQEANILLDTKSNILRAVRLDLSEASSIEATYDNQIEELVLNAEGEVLPDLDVRSVALKDEVSKPATERKLPLYVFKAEDGKKRYIIPLRGVGLWGPIWGFISLEEDFNTVYGATFDHKGETPGLGAEISEEFFQERFQGKKLLDTGGQFVSVNVVKSTEKTEYGPEHRVDAISGGTITSNGTDEMIENCVKPYMAYFSKLTTN